MITNTRSGWLNILEKSENFSMEDLNNTVLKNWTDTYRDNITAGLMTYRNQLLKQMDIPDFIEGITIENLQRWFLQPINEQELNYINELMKQNYWTIEELWVKCRNESIGIMTLVKCLNENVRFYDGMKIYHKNKVVNILNKQHIDQIEFIRKDTDFNVVQFLLHDLEYYTVPIALAKQQHSIRARRMHEVTNLEVTKENIEYLMAEHIKNIDFEYIKQAMSINSWTLKSLIQKSLKTGFNFFLLVGCPQDTLS